MCGLEPIMSTELRTAQRRHMRYESFRYRWGILELYEDDCRGFYSVGCFTCLATKSAGTYCCFACRVRSSAPGVISASYRR